MCQSRYAVRRLGAAICLLVLIGGAGMSLHAQSAPNPDPGGIATGDKTNVVDAAGNSFIVTEPTDKADPDYAAKKKAYDEFQAQAAREPLAVKLADGVGHVRIGTNAAWTLNTDPCRSCRPALRCSRAAWSGARTPRT